MDTARTTWQHTLRDRARRDASDRGVRSTQELTSEPDPNGDTKPSVRSRTSDPRPRTGDPIAKVGTPSRGEYPLDQGDQEPDGVLRTGRKHMKLQAQQAACAQPQVQQVSTPKSPGEAAEEAKRRRDTGKHRDKPGKSAGTSH